MPRPFAKDSATLNAISFDQILRDQDPFGNPGGRFDLSGVKLITPGALVQLAAACYALSLDGRPVQITVDNDDVRTYLVRSDFVSVVSAVAGFEPPIAELTYQVYRSYRGSNPLLLEVTKIERDTALPDLLDQIIMTLRERLYYPKYDAFDVATLVSEICQNTFDHNQQTCGFVAMQVYRSTGAPFLEIGVADYGDGLAATLKRNPKNLPINSDLDAIMRATEAGTSQYDDPTRGTGLYHLLDIAYKHRGSVQIRSGASSVRFRMDKKKGWAFAGPPMPGVQIVLALPTKT